MSRALRVRDCMTTALHCVRPDTEILAAVRSLIDHGISGLLVVDENAALVGILTERDCMRSALNAGYFDEHGGLVGEFMSTDVHCIDADTNLMDLASLFAESPYRRYPVTEKGRLVGLIARRDALRALCSGAWFSPPRGSQRR